MAETTNISWCDSTFNPWIGCTEVTPGCDNCYARVLDARWGHSHWGKGAPRKIMSDDYWKQPLKWDKAARAAGVKHKVFCASMADVMDDEAPAGQRQRLWDLINQTPNLIWQLLTKRPTRYGSYLPMEGFDYLNVWLGTSAENQHFYNLRWSSLRVIARDFNCTSFISYEPALGPLSMFEYSDKNIPPGGDRFEEVPDWIICGGESGNGRRPMEQKWAENLADECQMSGTQFFMKQMSARTPDEGSKLIPAHLLIRQMPEGHICDPKK